MDRNQLHQATEAVPWASVSLAARSGGATWDTDPT
eukprot:CAMPEP_0182531054 /NCGR_PEP_ID=MMETSP1323-20130603/7645_1 /TAXON_ID=236787 /ORGANISM="Florenciella parvula, Strain RCC1693" /LENGTH=34 /DNA_ID= /DNA_START= /DNA_END= /DNA_ORIENTATION=